MYILYFHFQGEISTILAEGRVAEEKNRQEQKWKWKTFLGEISSYILEQGIH